MGVLVYVENIEGKFKKSTFEVVSYAAEIASKMGVELTALSIGEVDQTHLAELGRF
ncbi:MAG: electron transfer flavoprotein subunit alpha/FixB family protein, partial [bacterium]